jgi:NAD(P)-dependent dehydrogenase (short-subunit alcohol dehydrogenase family)
MRTIVMTGGTSGLGAITSERIADAPDTRLLLGARVATPGRIESLPLDLTTLASVRSFAASVIERLGGTEIDALVLNAGTLNPDVDGRTPDGFETTFAVNHLAHYLLVRLLLGSLARGATVILTTSGTHDPAEGAGFPVPLHADARLLAHPECVGSQDRKPGVAARRAYTASKLCNVLTARALAAAPEARVREIAGIAYCPGQTPGTGLVRNMPLPLRTDRMARVRQPAANGGAAVQQSRSGGASAGRPRPRRSPSPRRQLLRRAAPRRAHLARAVRIGAPR